MAFYQAKRVWHWPGLLNLEVLALCSQFYSEPRLHLKLLYDFLNKEPESKLEVRMTYY